MKRQNKHIKELETLLDRLESRHKEYQAQIRDYSKKLEEYRSWEHLEGDDRLKQQLQSLQIERDALAAELQEKQDKQAHNAALNESTDSSRETSTSPTASVAIEEIDRLRAALEATKLKLDETSRSSATLQQRLKNTIESQQSELFKQQEQANQLKTACDALKARLSHVASQHASQLQSVNSEHESKLQTLNSTIVQMQHEISKEKEALAAALEEKKNRSESSTTVEQSVESSENLVKEVEELRKRVEDLTKANEALQSSPLPIKPVEEKKDDRVEQIQKLEEKLQSKQALLVKAHKHLGELTAQLADSNMRAQQLSSEKSRLELASASVSELRHRNAELEASLEEARLEFERYRIKVAAAESEKISSTQSEENGPSTGATEGDLSSTVSSAVPIVLQDKIDELSAEIEKLRAANEHLRSEGEVTNAELTSIRAKHQTALSHLRHYKEKEASRESSSEKFGKEREALEEKHQMKLSELANQLESQAATSANQLARLRAKADDAIKQRDAEISSLKDMVEVLKIQASHSEPKRPSLPLSRATDISSEPSRRRVSTDSSGSPMKRRPRQGDETLGESSSSRSGSLSLDPAHGSSSTEHTPRDDTQAPTQALLGRIKSLQEQVSELEQLLTLSREQEQFLKLELRRNDRLVPSSGTSSGASSSSRPNTPAASFEMISASDYSILRNLLKNMLESGEMPNLMVFADLLKFSNEELDQIKIRAAANTGTARVASAVETGMNALWNVFGTPQRR